MRALLRRVVQSMGYTLHRWPTNRFDGMEDALVLLRTAGFRPQTIVDIGANVGVWTDLAARIFPGAVHHMVEPQPSCWPSLERFAPPRFHVHRFALTESGVEEVTMAGAGDTGAHVVRGAGAEAGSLLRVKATTLDALLGGRLSLADRPFLKLDVEGHELTVLEAGRDVLAAAEVVLLEIQFFPIDGNDAPIFGDVMRFMVRHGFVLYDFANLAARPRDLRLRMGDAVFVRATSRLAADVRWS